MDWKIRPHADNGLWCSSLLPLSLLASVFSHPESCIYTRVSVISCGLLISSLLRTILYQRKAYYLNAKFYVFCSIISVIIATVLWKITSFNLFLSFLASITSLWFCCWFASTLLIRCAYSFTVGEAFLVSQGVTLFLSSCFFCITREINNYLHETVSEEGISQSVKFSQIYMSLSIFWNYAPSLVMKIPDLQVAADVLLLGCMLLVYSLYMGPHLRTGPAFYITCFIIGGLAYLFWWFYLSKDPVLWLLMFSFGTTKRVMLITLWFCSTLASVTFVVQQNKMKRVKSTSIAARKYFHVVTIVIFVPGVILDPDLLFLASAIALTIFIVLEIFAVDLYPSKVNMQPFHLVSLVTAFLRPMRYLELQPLIALGVGAATRSWLWTGNYLSAIYYILFATQIVRVLKVAPVGLLVHDAFQMFLDEKDSGILILTHIYLLIGCSCPLWMYPQNFYSNTFHISLLSGVISIGLGDTVAAVCGTLWGKHKWPGTKKTVEGTSCAIVVQLIFAAPFLLLGHMPFIMNIVITVLSIIFTSILEANTSQVDNLVLPLFMFSIIIIL